MCRAFGKIERNADNDRTPLGLCLTEGVADADGESGRVVKTTIGGAGGGNEGGLVDCLIVPGAAEWRLAGNDDKRNTGAHRRWKRRHQLRQPGSTGHGGNPDLTCFAGIGHGGCDGAMLVTDMDHLRAETGKMRRHMHVGVAKQCETVADIFRRHRLGEDFVPVPVFMVAHQT